MGPRDVVGFPPMTLEPRRTSPTVESRMTARWVTGRLSASLVLITTGPRRQTFRFPIEPAPEVPLIRDLQE